MRLTNICFVLLLVFSANSFATLDHREKIGIGTWEVDGVATSLKNVENMKFAWYYTWRTTNLYSPYANSTRTVPFIPMIWGSTHVDESVPAADALLSFNEPDHTSQAQMTVDQAISYWPTLMNKGLRLGSPAQASRNTTSTAWLAQFMNKANDLGYRVDFIAVHYYSGNGDVEEFRNYLNAIYTIYKKPIWVTEWGMADWTNTGRFTFEENAAFAAKALEMLDDLPFVERHAWFSGPVNKDGLNTYLFDANNQITVVGKVFQQALAGTLPTPVAPTLGSNLMLNGGFESNFNSWVNWGGTTNLDSINPTAGIYAARVGAAAGGMGQNIINKMTAGKTYRLQGKAKIGNRDEQGWIGIKFYDSAGVKISDLSRQILSTDYDLYPLDFTYPVGAVQASPFFWKSAGSGSYLYLDEFNLAELIPGTTPAITVDNSAPVVSISAPGNGATFPRSTYITLAANASDNVGVTQVLFYVNGSLVCSPTSAPYTCSWKTPRKSGSRVIQVKAKDAAGNIGVSSSITVYVK